MLILASNSPRRKEILKLLQLEFITETAAVDEIAPENTTVEGTAEALACLKATEVYKNHRQDTVIGADTVVVLNGEIFGKPKSKDDAKRMLTLLSGKTHTVYTGVAVIKNNVTYSFTSATLVEFCNLNNSEIDEYIKSGEPMDKAGAYAIQGLGCKFIESINGDFYSVMGLPAAKLYNTLKSLNILEE